MGNKPSKGSSEWRRRSGSSEWEFASSEWPETDRSTRMATGGTNHSPSVQPRGTEATGYMDTSLRPRFNGSLHVPVQEGHHHLDNTSKIPVVKSNSWGGHQGSLRWPLNSRVPVAVGPDPNGGLASWQWSSGHRNILNSGHAYKKPVTKANSWHYGYRGEGTPGTVINPSQYSLRGEGSIRSSPGMESYRSVGGVSKVSSGWKSATPSPHAPHRTHGPVVHSTYSVPLGSTKKSLGIPSSYGHSVSLKHRGSKAIPRAVGHPGMSSFQASSVTTKLLPDSAPIHNPAGGTAFRLQRKRPKGMDGGARGGPRLISIPRCGDQGFGFTLRHFIVYPPEISELLSGNVSLECGLSSLDPLDTIFIKNVKRGGAAHRAGLRTGDRVVSVNGENVTGRSYQEVVGIIQLSPPFLQLMVVPREQDLLQQVFGDTAHNPESNLDLNRVQSPLPHELPSYPHNQQYAHPHPHPPLYPHHNQYGPQFPSPFPQGTESLSSSWSSETSLSSYPIMSSGPHPPPQQQQQQPIPPFHGHHPIQQNVSGQPIRRPTPRAPTLRHPVPHPAPHPPPMRHPSPSTMHRPPPPHGAQMPIQHNAQQQRGVAAVNRSNSRKPSLTADKVAAAAGGGSRRQSLPVVTDRRQAVYTIQNSLTSVPQHVPSPGPGTPSPIPDSTNIPAGTPAPAHLASNDQAGAQPSQAPGPSLAGVYEPIMDRATGIRASIKDSRRLERDPDGRVYEVVKTRIVESGPGKPNPNVKNGAPLQRSASSVGEAESKRVRRQSLSPPRLKTDINNAGGRSTSACRSNAGLHNGSVQSLNSLQNEVPVKSRRPRPYGQRSNTEPLYASIDAVHSNDKLVIERIKRNVDRKEEFLNRPAQPIWLPSSKAPGVHRDYHVSPQKMPKPQWPPLAQTPPSPGSITKALSVVAAKGEHHQLRRARSEIERCTRSNTRHGSFPNIQLVSQAETIIPSTSFTTDDLPLSRSSQISPPSSLVSNGIPKPYNGTTTATISTSDPAAAAAAAARYGKAFVTTLSRIQENIPAQELGSQSSLASTTTQGTRICDSTASSLMGTPFGSQSSLNSPSSRSIPLAWVGDNERIKQLQIVSKRAKQFENREDKENFAKSAFQRFELTRLSQRSKVPNVAKMKEELDRKEDDSSLKVAAEESPTAMRARDHQILIMGGVGNRAMPIGGGRIHCEPPGGFNIRPYSDPDVLDREHSNSMESGVSMWSVQSAEETRTKHKSSSGQNNSYRMNTGLLPGSDGEVGKGHGERKRCPPSTGGTQPSPQPSPTMTSLLTSEYHAPRPKRPTFLQLKNHAMPALSASEASPSNICSEGSGRGRLERLHEFLPFSSSTNQNAPSSSARSSLSNSMCQIPTVATPTPPTPEDGTVTPVVTPGATPTTATPTNASSPSNAITPTIITSTSNHLQPVHRRTKHLYDDEGERLVRRVSYLKATSGDRMYSDSDLDSDSEEHRSLRVDGGLVAAAGILSAATPLGPLCCMDLPSPASLQSAVVRQGNLHVKLTMVDGKKAGDRSWKTVWAVVQGRALIFYKDKQHATQTPLGCEEQISLRGADVEVASDYTKRRNVMRLSTHGGSQLLLQPDTQADMVAWLSTIHHNITQDSTDGTKGSINNNNVSPQSSTKSSHKHNSTLRTRSPTGQSPSTKTRKASSTDSSSSPKNKTWKGRIGRHLRKMHAGSPSNPPSTSLPEGATIGVCLEDCPQSEDNECVPLLVSLCIKVVEERGMQTQGIYRIPGNKAAVTHLTETINNGQNCIDHTDPRWSDVNVISSMLKQFFQKLPDPLVTMEYYSAFIEASKTEDPSQRMLEIKKVIHELPDHHYETMRYLMMHLADIVKSCEFNKMDVKNLAIVFGPTIVRSGDDNMVTMVTDMSHQCRIVETIISHAEWYFNDDECDEDSLPILVAAASAAQQVRSPMEEFGMSSLCDNELLRDSNATTPSSQDLLLGNINKLDGSAKGDYKKDLFSSVISAANRKVNKVKHKRPTEGHNKSVDDKLEKESFEERDIDKETELRKQRTVHKQMENMVELPDPKPMSQRKISSMSLMSVQSNAQSVQSSVKDNSQNNQLLPNLDSSSERTSGISDSSKLPNSVDDGRLFCVVKKDSVDKTNSSVHPTTSLSSAVVSSVSSSSSSSIQQQSSQALGDSSSSTSSLLGDDVAIRSYAGLSASTQERIRRFEMETRAMLHRDMLRHRKETEKRAVERSQLEEALQRAKQDMESDDILDQLADNPTDMVRKISDYSWRLQSQSEHGSGSGPTSGLSGVLGTSGSSSNGSSDGANISSGQHTTVQHSHPPNPSPLTPSTNAITQHMVPSLDIPRCSSLDSLRDPSAAASHDDGSDLLSAITATFEEKMRSLQDSPLSLMHSESDSDVSDTARKDSSSRGEKFGQCRLYRDPSLHRRRSSGPRHAHGNNTTPNSQVKETSPNRNLSEGCNPGSVTKSGNASNNKQLKEDNKRDNKVKRSDSLTKSEKTENNLKEKTEKRARDLKRTDTQESINEKKPKEMKRSDIQEKESLLKSSSSSPKKSDNQDGPNTSNRRSSASNNRKTNVKELKEKFEQNSPVGGSMKSSANSNNNNVANNKGGKLGMRRHRGPIKRRHTVGGTKDLAKWAWLQSGGEVSPRYQKANNRVSAWERLQPLVADEKLNTDRSLETWLARERIRTSSPDLSRPQPLVLHCDIDDKENIHRRFSVQEVAVAVSPLYPVLESHV